MISKLIRLLSNLQFAILNLLSIGLFSIIGTLIEQDKSLQYYQINYPISTGVRQVFNWKLIQLLSINQIYTCYWFNSLLLIFGLSLICCTVTQQYPSLKFFSRCRLYTSPIQFKKINSRKEQRCKNFGNFLYNLQTNHYSTFQSNSSFYGYKGLIGRISPIFVHISLILILLGALKGTFQGFTAQELVPRTEIFHIQNLIKKGNLSNLNPVNMRVNDFWIQYNENMSIKQFYSNISIFNTMGDELKRKTIAVNTPLHFRDVTIYQTDWTILGIRLCLEEKTNDQKTLQLPLLKKKISGNEYWLTWFANNNKEFAILLNSVDGTLSLYNINGELIQKLSLNQSYALDNNTKIIPTDVIGCTGLQIKTDPGIPVLYSGFALLIISVAYSYLSFSQFWLSKFEKSFVIGAQANRSKIQIRRELNSLNLEFEKR